ncbi:hypothetical protein FK514_29795, partial [Klebsiella pneumoniae]|nr:hypothetical protein [Klebsiella pneumoniae]
PPYPYSDGPVWLYRRVLPRRPGPPPGRLRCSRILLGFERADAGQVTIDGIDAGHLSREAQRQLRRKIQFAIGRLLSPTYLLRPLERQS